MADVRHADLWRLSSNTTMTAGPQYLSNWNRPTASGHGRIGAGMSLSGSTFSFPETGIWYINYSSTCAVRGSRALWSSLATTGTHLTVDNSTWTEHTAAYLEGHETWYVTSSTYYNMSQSASMLLDIDNITLQKVRFGGTYEFTMTNVYHLGSNGNHIDTSVMFIRMGDT